MKEAVTIFFFANNNHLSNVKTLQSIYQQDYRQINLIVCNDCTYGFQSERLLNNFEAGRGKNIEYIYFLENPWPMGECASQTQLWDRIDSDYYLVMHSGDRFVSAESLRLSVNALRLDQSLAAVVSPVEIQSDDPKKSPSLTTITRNPDSLGVFSSSELGQLRLHRVRDCMTVYRLSALKKLTLEEDDRSRFLSKQALPALLERGRRITVLSNPMCCYSDSAIADQPVPEPAKLGRDTLKNITALLQERQQVQQPLFHADVPPAGTPKRNIHRMLYKLTTLKKIGACCAGALLLAIAGGVFLNIRQLLMSIIGWSFLGLAACAVGAAAVMLVLNLYYKKNPQRLVNN